MTRRTVQQRRDRTTHRLVVSAIVLVGFIALARACGAYNASPTSTRSAVASLGDARLIISTNHVTMPIVGGRQGAWRAMTPCAKTVTIRHGTLIPPVDVIIDPGHGGEEAGAAAYGLREADVNLAVARALQHDLAAQHITAALTRTADYRLPIATRATIVNRDRPRVFVSIHHNSGAAAPHRGPGTEVYYQHLSPRARRLAGVIWRHLTTAIAPFGAHWVGASDTGAIYRLDQHRLDYYGVLRRTPHTPSVLVEASYLDEPTEAALLHSNNFLASEAAGISAGIRSYLDTRDPGAGYHTPIQRGYQDNGGGGGTYVGCIDPRIAR